VYIEHGAKLQEKIRMEEGIVSTAAGPGAEEAGFVAIPKPAGDLFDGGLLEIVG